MKIMIQQMKDRYGKRDSGIELARIIGCLIVIGVHTLLGYEQEGGWDNSRLFLGMIFADGVAIFWLIMGAFLYNNVKYSRLINRTIKTIVVPMIIVGIIVFYFGDWLTGFSSFSTSIHHTKEEYINVLHSILRLNNGIGELPHFWYLFVYILLIICYPIFKAFVDFLDEDIKRTKIFMVVSLALLVLNDTTNNETFVFSHHSINGLVPAAIISIWGHIIYVNKDRIKKIYAVYSIVIFLLANFLRLYIQIRRVNNGVFGKAIMSWATSFGLICSICVVVFCICIMKDKKRSNYIINYIASYTLFVYLMHWLIKDLVYNIGLTGFIMKHTCNAVNGIKGEILYSTLIIITIFAICFVLSFILRIVRYPLQLIMKHYFYKVDS